MKLQAVFHRFNPSQVRFKLNLSDKNIWYALMFQSLTGSIQTLHLRMLFWLFILFQSLTGSIQTQGRGVDQGARLFCFNPSQVRFKLWDPVSPLLCLSCFNPSQVRFKLKFKNKTMEEKMSFNPSQVRFKQIYVKEFPVLVLMFQSLTGSIQTFTI